MFTKVLLIVLLSFSISCFAADTTSNSSTSPNSSTSSNELILPAQQSDSSTKNETSESSKDNDSGEGQEPSTPKKGHPMEEYCKEHTC